MSQASLEHVNVTARDPKAVAARLQKLFGWEIRWEGAAMNDGYTVHVGNGSSYVAIYSHQGVGDPRGSSYDQASGLNHIGIVVKDLDAAELRVKELGLEPHSHADYEPGRRFYYDDPEGIEFEVISYQ